MFGLAELHLMNLTPKPHIYIYIHIYSNYKYICTWWILHLRQHCVLHPNHKTQCCHIYDVYLCIHTHTIIDTSTHSNYKYICTKGCAVIRTRTTHIAGCGRNCNSIQMCMEIERVFIYTRWCAVINRTLLLKYRALSSEHTATPCSTLQYTATHVNTSAYTHKTVGLKHCRTLQHTATHCNTLQHAWIPPHIHTYRWCGCNGKHAATHCNTLQHTATLVNTSLYTHIQVGAGATVNTIESKRAMQRALQAEEVFMCVAVCCSVLQRVVAHVAACCSVMQRDSVRQHAMQCAMQSEEVFTCVAMCCSVLQCVAVRKCSTQRAMQRALQAGKVFTCVTVCCNALHFVAMVVACCCVL